jgi:sigma-E factor negative regulatory protein RseA
MKDAISALMDGELDDKSAALAIDALRRDGEALEAWRTYHVASDAMRDTRFLSEGFGARLAARLTAEPTVLAPGRIPAQPRKWFALSAAASVAAVALVGWLAFGTQPAGPLQPSVAQLAPAQAPVEPAPPPRIPLPSAANDYLLAHQGYSPRVWLQGMAPYARTVADQAEPRK